LIYEFLFVADCAADVVCRCNAIVLVGVAGCTVVAVVAFVWSAIVAMAGCTLICVVYLWIYIAVTAGICTCWFFPSRMA
jgi:hypothetical protein